MYERTMEMKAKNGALKISLSVGGWNHASKGFKVQKRRTV
jgi:GH18 family chitinase